MILIIMGYFCFSFIFLMVVVEVKVVPVAVTARIVVLGIVGIALETVWVGIVVSEGEVVVAATADAS